MKVQTNGRRKYSEVKQSLTSYDFMLLHIQGDNKIYDFFKIIVLFKEFVLICSLKAFTKMDGHECSSFK